MKHILFFFIIFSFWGCNNTPKPIVYGTDGCHYCSMTIVDRQHAAALMTKKGRTYAFDASECMLNYLKKIDTSTVAVLLVNDYNSPGEMVDATEATYLISEKIPSPMGAFLTAFATKEAAQKVQEESQGKCYTWEELLRKFK